jgi:hypothetical protein
MGLAGTTRASLESLFHGTLCVLPWMAPPRCAFQVRFCRDRFCPTGAS